MEVVVINSIKDIKNYGELCVAHGFFDGVHKAHQSLILNAIDHAKKNGMRSAVVTFDKKYVEGKTKLEYLQHLRLSTLSRKTELLMNLGVEIMFILKFDVFKNMSASDYIAQIVVPLGTKHFVMGKDNKFGTGGKGDSCNIIKLANDKFSVSVVNLLFDNNEKISTSTIKRMFASCVIEDINLKLNYFYKLNGNVVRGHQVGRTLGFPTANMHIFDEMLIPRQGVYATLVKYNGIVYYSMTNIGYNPTVDFRESMIVETNIFDFNQEIYDESIDLYFVKKIRDEKKFDSVEMLVSQLKEDKESVNKIHQDIDLDMVI